MKKLLKYFLKLILENLKYHLKIENSKSIFHFHYHPYTYTNLKTVQNLTNFSPLYHSLPLSLFIEREREQNLGQTKYYVSIFVYSLVYEETFFF